MRTSLGRKGGAWVRDRFGRNDEEGRKAITMRVLGNRSCELQGGYILPRLERSRRLLIFALEENATRWSLVDVWVGNNEKWAGKTHHPASLLNS